MMSEELGPDFRTGAIGPGGETLVPFANFLHVQHAAGRGGPGAVFGSKKLKGVAVRGTGGIRVAPQPSEYITACKELHDIIMENPVRPAFRWAGTTGMLPVVNEVVGLPWRNHQDDKAPDVSSIHNDEIAKYVKQYEACSGCNVICGSVVEFERNGKKYRSERVEHESVWALGPDCGIVDLVAIFEANWECDLMGIDTMTAGSTIAWAMEMTECGLLSQEEADGLDFTFGNADVLVPAIRKMGSREGIGKILSLGSRGAARALGRGEEYAMQVKGLDLAAYAARGFTGMGLSYATTGRGGDHNKAFTVAAEFLGVLGDYDRYTMEGKPELVKRMQDSTAIIDSLIMCMFTVDLGITVDLYARCANLPTGMNIAGNNIYEDRTSASIRWRGSSTSRRGSRAQTTRSLSVFRRARHHRTRVVTRVRSTMSWTSTTSRDNGMPTACPRRIFASGSASDFERGACDARSSSGRSQRTRRRRYRRPGDRRSTQRHHRRDGDGHLRRRPPALLGVRPRVRVGHHDGP